MFYYVQQVAANYVCHLVVGRLGTVDLLEENRFLLQTKIMLCKG